ncbi:MAG: hypothetical protein JO349_05110 [Candidatus Eremiobacteraeota bacterium]|nr:hypothetical protein [Candidatus Eremiobacteraeota bacterium]
MSERPPPDFAMIRAVEIMAKFIEQQIGKPPVPPAPIDRPVVLFNENLSFELDKTTRGEVERAFGSGFPYPAKGFHSYGLRHDGKPALISAFYDRDDLLIGVEHYYITSKTAPSLAPRAIGTFRMIPGEIALGMATTKLSDEFVPAVGGPSPAIYQHRYEVRFPAGVAYVMGNKMRVERLVLYADHSQQQAQ